MMRLAGGAADLVLAGGNGSGSGAAQSWPEAAAASAATLVVRQMSTAAASPTPIKYHSGGLSSTANIVDLVICLLSFIGSLVIIVPYCVSRRGRKLRHSLILGLATSDLTTSLVVISSTAYLMDGGDLSRAPRFCDFVGFSLASSIFTQHLWNLSIAVATYMILVHPLSTFTLTIERYLIWLWPIIWSIAFIVNGFSWAFVGWSNAGGYCGINKARGGSLYSPIFNFVPRGLVVVIIIVLYTHLFFFLRRTNLFSSVSNRVSSHDGGNGTTRSLGGRSLGGMRGEKPGENGTMDGCGASQRFSGAAVFGDLRRGSAGTTSSSARGGSSSTQEKCSTSKMSPSTGHDIKLLEYNRAAGGATRRSSLISPMDTRTAAPGSPRTFTAQREDATAAAAARDESLAPSVMSEQGATAASTADESYTSTSRLVAEAGSRRPSGYSGRPHTASEVGPRKRPAHIVVPTRASNATMQSGRATPTGVELAEDGHDSDSDASTQDSLSLDPYSPLKRMTPRRDVVDFNMTSAPREHLNHYSLSSASGTPMSGRRRANSAATSTRNTPRTGTVGLPSLPASPSSPMSPHHHQRAVLSIQHEAEREDQNGLGEGWTWGMPVGGAYNPGPASEGPSAAAAAAAAAGVTTPKSPPAAATWTGRRPSATPSVTVAIPPDPRGSNAKSDETATGGGRRPSHISWWRRVSSVGGATPARESTVGGANGGEARGSESRFGTGTGSSSTTDEHGVESLGSTLNRQASVLMLLYPAAYCLLFSISIVRIITDLAVPSTDPSKANNALPTVSRWFIFAQGAFDALIFQFVERHFRKRMKRRRQRAAGEAVDTSSAIARIARGIVARKAPPKS